MLVMPFASNFKMMENAATFVHEIMYMHIL